MRLSEMRLKNQSTLNLFKNLNYLFFALKKITNYNTRKKVSHD